MKKVLFTSVMRIAILGINSYNDSSRSIKQTKAEQGEFRVRFCAIEMPLYTNPTLAFRDSSKSYTDMRPMSQSNVAYSQKSTKPTRDNNQVFLPSNAQHNLSSTTREESKKRNNDRTL